MKYYHWIVEEIKTGERYETITRTKRAPHFTGKFKVVACCGFHETPNTQRETECNENEIL